MDQRYYAVLFLESEGLGIARSSDPEMLFLPDAGELAPWQPLKLSLTDGEFSDYLANDLGVRLCSERMRDVIDRNVGPRDNVRWLPVSVEDHNGRSRAYWILHFPTPADVISQDKSILADGFVVKAVLRRDRLEGHAVFSCPGGGNWVLIICDRVKAALEQAGCTGVEYSELRAQ